MHRKMQKAKKDRKSWAFLLLPILMGLMVCAHVTYAQSYSKGCNSHSCEVRVCKLHSCKQRVLSRTSPAAKAVASVYGPGLYGNHLGCGGTLQPGMIGVANKSLPCQQKLQLCYAKCITARVIDRGPYVAGRTFDLTVATQQAIGAPYGTPTVRYRILH